MNIKKSDAEKIKDKKIVGLKLLGVGYDENNNAFYNFDLNGRSTLVSYQELVKSIKDTLLHLQRDIGLVAVSKHVQDAIRDEIQQLAEAASLNGTKDFDVLIKCGWNAASTLYGTFRNVHPSNTKNVKVYNSNKSYRPNKWKTNGTLTEWVQNVAKPCEGHDLLILSLCMAFAAPLLKPLGRMSFMFYFKGASSRGKTILIKLAGSVWGGGEGNGKGFLEVFQTTANGTENWGMGHNDALLPLDDTSNLEGDEKTRASIVSAAVFRLVEGSEKVRKTDASGPQEWRCVTMLSGNQCMADIMRLGNKKWEPQHQVRCVEIRVPDKLGVLSVMPSDGDPSKFMKDLCAAADHYYGVTIDTFLDRLTSEMADEESRKIRLEWLQERMKFFRKTADVSGSNGVADRLADHFALIYAAGSLASQYNILPWERKMIGAVILRCFKNHIADTRAIGLANATLTLGPADTLREYILNRKLIKLPIDFSKMDDEEFKNSVGFKNKRKGEVEFLFSAWRLGKILRPHGNLIEVVRKLANEGYLVINREKLQVKRKVRIKKSEDQRDKVYCIRKKILESSS